MRKIKTWLIAISALSAIVGGGYFYSQKNFQSNKAEPSPTPPEMISPSPSPDILGAEDEIDYYIPSSPKPSPILTPSLSPTPPPVFQEPQKTDNQEVYYYEIPTYIPLPETSYVEPTPDPDCLAKQAEIERQMDLISKDIARLQTDLANVEEDITQEARGKDINSNQLERIIAARRWELLDLISDLQSDLYLLSFDLDC